MKAKMLNKASVILCFIMVIYGSAVLLTQFTLTGFWTDLLFSISLFCVCLLMIFSHSHPNRLLTIAMRTVVISFVVVVSKLFAPFKTPFFSDTLKMRSFYFQRIDNRLFNAYFKPVGAYAGGYGNFYVTESPLYFPIIEKLIYVDRTMHHDFCADSFEGEPIDNSAVVRQIIKEEIINKEDL